MGTHNVHICVKISASKAGWAKLFPDKSIWCWELNVFPERQGFQRVHVPRRRVLRLGRLARGHQSHRRCHACSGPLPRPSAARQTGRRGAPPPPPQNDTENQDDRLRALVRPRGQAFPNRPGAGAWPDMRGTALGPHTPTHGPNNPQDRDNTDTLREGNKHRHTRG